MKLSPTMRRCFDQVGEKLANLEPKLLYYEEAARLDPRYADEARELRDLYDHLVTLRAGCLAAATPPGR